MNTHYEDDRDEDVMEVESSKNQDKNEMYGEMKYHGMPYYGMPCHGMPCEGMHKKGMHAMINGRPMICFPMMSDNQMFYGHQMGQHKEEDDYEDMYRQHGGHYYPRPHPYYHPRRRRPYFFYPFYPFYPPHPYYPVFNQEDEDQDEWY